MCELALLLELCGATLSSQSVNTQDRALGGCEPLRPGNSVLFLLSQTSGQSSRPCLLLLLTPAFSLRLQLPLPPPCFSSALLGPSGQFSKAREERNHNLLNVHRVLCTVLPQPLKSYWRFNNPLSWFSVPI